MALRAAFADPFSAVALEGSRRSRDLASRPRTGGERRGSRPGGRRDPEKDGKAAVFLPQVATEQGWGRHELLDNLCFKAGLTDDC
jgi:hypothetical protein